MQTHKQGYSTWKPDLIVKGKGVGWGQPSNWYRQVGDDYGNVPLIAKFRPSGWNKSYEYEVIFKDIRNNSDKFELQFNLNRTSDTGLILSTKKILSMATKVTPKMCPFCSNSLIFDQSNKRWVCSKKETCQFNYSPQTCKLMFEEFKDMKLDNDHSRNIFSNFDSLENLGMYGDMNIKQEIFNYNE
jgi:ribosomal protein S27AE